jgi:hypothetical protein
MNNVVLPTWRVEQKSDIPLPRSIIVTEANSLIALIAKTI